MIKAIYYHTRFMLQKHYRNRVLTTHYQALVKAAERAVAAGSLESMTELADAASHSRFIIKTHGYTPKKASNASSAEPN
jgi:hypothetical protein